MSSVQDFIKLLSLSSPKKTATIFIQNIAYLVLFSDTQQLRLRQNQPDGKNKTEAGPTHFSHKHKQKKILKVKQTHSSFFPFIHSQFTSHFQQTLQPKSNTNITLLILFHHSTFFSL